jgi:AraC-like DNA-binding protein
MYEHHIFHFDQVFFWDIKSDNEVWEGRDSHCHKDCEIHYMIDGEGEISLEGHVYHIVSDSLLFIPSNYFHQWKLYPEKINHRICIHFLPEMLSETQREGGDFFSNLFVEPFYFLNGSQYDLNFFFFFFTECALMKEPLQKTAIESRMIAMLSQIHYLWSTKAVKPVVLDERIRKVIMFLGENLQKTISLDDLSDRFLITKNHLNLLFKKTVGTTIKKYITVKRLGLVRQQILYGTRLSEAVYQAGFNDYSSFYRAYKSFYGSTPSELLKEGINAFES